MAFAVAIPVFAILIVCYRAYYVAQAIASDRIWREAGTLLMIGLLTVGVVTLLCLIALGANRSWFKKLLLLIATLSVCAIALDTFIVAELDNRLTFSVEPVVNFHQRKRSAMYWRD